MVEVSYIALGVILLIDLVLHLIYHGITKLFKFLFGKSKTQEKTGEKSVQEIQPLLTNPTPVPPVPVMPIQTPIPVLPAPNKVVEKPKQIKWETY